MKLAAFGDIHSNHYAFEACLELAEKEHVDGILFLGDYVSDCPCPQVTLKLMREAMKKYPCRIIRGNREEYLLSHEENPDDGWKYNSRSGSLMYTFDNLAKEDLDFFRSLPRSMQVSIDGEEPFEICHGSMSKSRVMLLPGTPEADEAINEMNTRLLVCAHTHASFVLERRGKMVVNGGPIGVPSENRTDAGFVMLESRGGRWSVRQMRAKYDIEAELREFRESGFYEKANVWARAIAATLRTGGDYTMECLRLVDRYSKDSGLPFETEALWERAAEALGI